MELEDVEWNLRGIGRYWNSVWNRIDVTCFTTTVAIAALRIAGKAELDSPRTTLTMRGDQVAVESLQLPRYEEDVGALNVARVLYSLLSIPVFMRLIQFLRYFKSVGGEAWWHVGAGVELNIGSPKKPRHGCQQDSGIHVCTPRPPLSLFVGVVYRILLAFAPSVLSIVLAEMVKDVILFAIILAVTVSSFAVAFGTLLNDVDSQVGF